ncbi:MAG TPA: hypothetical protein VMV18_09185 [bacterium]|nr:hypothetical protein [bacterium]
MIALLAGLLWMPAGALAVGASEAPAAPPAAVASPTPAPAAASAHDDLGFARSLYDEGDYYRAIGEAKRFVYFHPEDARADEAKLLVGMSYLAGGQWVAAAAALEPIVSRGLPGKVGADAAFALADTRMGAGDYDLAALEFRRFGEDYPEDARAALSALRMGWARMFAADVLASLDAKKGRAAFTEAARELDAIPVSSPEHARAVRLAAGSRRIAGLSYKHPALAGAMSAVIPGAGQVYAGRWKDGLIAFFVNSLFIGGAVESYLKGNTVASGILVLFEMGWYTGNIYSAVNSAHRTNDEHRAALLKDLKKDLYVRAAPIAGPHGGGAVAILGGTF